MKFDFVEQGSFSLGLLHQLHDDPTSTPQLNDFCIAVAREGNVLAISGKYKVAILTKHTQWLPTILDVQQSSSYKAGDRITSLAAIQINNVHISSCILVGHLNGYLRVYSEGGVLLVSQRFHKGPVLRLVTRVDEDGEEVMVLYDSGVVVSGLSLTAAVVSAHASLSSSLSSSSSSSSVPPPMLTFRKWHLFGPELITDIMYIPTQASYGDIGSGCIIAAGRDPILSFYTINEEQNSSLSVAVALASTVASKLTSAVVSFAKSWWRPPPLEGNESSVKDEAVMESPVSLTTKHSISDAQRHVLNLTPAPASYHLAVATDGFGRISLIDTVGFLVIRMWKGYRDAQCGWLQHTSGLYLVIYAARRGLVEIWGMRHRSRVVVQSIGTGWKLLPCVSNCYAMDPNGCLYHLCIDS